MAEHLVIDLAVAQQNAEVRENAERALRGAVDALQRAVENHERLASQEVDPGDSNPEEVGEMEAAHAATVAASAETLAEAEAVVKDAMTEVERARSLGHETRVALTPEEEAERSERRSKAEELRRAEEAVLGKRRRLRELQASGWKNLTPAEREEGQALLFELGRS